MLNTLTLPGSRTEDITNIDTMSNLNITGQFVFRIDDTVPPPGCNSTTSKLLNMYIHTIIYKYHKLFCIMEYFHSSNQLKPRANINCLIFSSPTMAV